MWHTNWGLYVCDTQREIYMCVCDISPTIDMYVTCTEADIYMCVTHKLPACILCTWQQSILSIRNTVRTISRHWWPSADLVMVVCHSLMTVISCFCWFICTKDSCNSYMSPLSSMTFVWSCRPLTLGHVHGQDKDWTIWEASLGSVTDHVHQGVRTLDIIGGGGVGQWQMFCFSLLAVYDRVFKSLVFMICLCFSCTYSLFLDMPNTTNTRSTLRNVPYEYYICDTCAIHVWHCDTLHL